MYKIEINEKDFNNRSIMKLKYININGHGVLVDENAKINGDEICHYVITWANGFSEIFNFNNNIQPSKIPLAKKVLFAEKELNLEIPILPNWRNWEVEQLANKLISCSNNIDIKLVKEVWKAGYNHNKAKYTEDDLINAFRAGADYEREGIILQPDEHGYIKSIQKYPTYIEMESEEILGDEGIIKVVFSESDVKPKLITNSDNKQEGIIKNIYYAK